MKIISDKIDYYDFLEADDWGAKQFIRNEGVDLRLYPGIFNPTTKIPYSTYLVKVIAGTFSRTIVIVREENHITVYDTFAKFLESEKSMTETINSILRVFDRDTRLTPNKEIPLIVGWVDAINIKTHVMFRIDEIFGKTSILYNPILRGSLLEMAFPAIDIYRGIKALIDY